MEDYTMNNTAMNVIDERSAKLLLTQQQKLYDYCNEVSSKITTRSYTLLGLIAGSYPLMVGALEDRVIKSILFLVYVVIGVLVYKNIRPRNQMPSGLEARKYLEEVVVESNRDRFAHMCYISAIEDVVNNSEKLEMENSRRAKQFNLALLLLLLTWVLYGLFLCF